MARGMMKPGKKMPAAIKAKMDKKKKNGAAKRGNGSRRAKK